MRKGFFMASEKVDAIGFSVAIVYLEDVKELQFCIHIGNIANAIGYAF